MNTDMTSSHQSDIGFERDMAVYIRLILASAVVVVDDGCVIRELISNPSKGDTV